MDRFWKKVNKTEYCWEWTGRPTDGYGRFTVKGVVYRAHRFSYILAFGPIPDGLVIRHTCDNRICVRPEHLLAGTVADNNWDTARRGRNVQQKKTHCVRNHPFIDGNFYVDHNNVRICRVCKRERTAEVRRLRKLDKLEKVA